LQERYSPATYTRFMSKVKYQWVRQVYQAMETVETAKKKLLKLLNLNTTVKLAKW